ncbi:MAG: hypothetical protein ACXVLQ_07660 [Bacteriovorax sp.]
MKFVAVLIFSNMLTAYGSDNLDACTEKLRAMNTQYNIGLKDSLPVGCPKLERQCNEKQECSVPENKCPPESGSFDAKTGAIALPFNGREKKERGLIVFANGKSTYVKLPPMDKFENREKRLKFRIDDTEYCGHASRVVNKDDTKEGSNFKFEATENCKSIDPSMAMYYYTPETVDLIEETVKILMDENIKEVVKSRNAKAVEELSYILSRCHEKANDMNTRFFINRKIEELKGVSEKLTLPAAAGGGLSK